jgi:hypothetical protein
MEHLNGPGAKHQKISRQTLRLTIRVTESGFNLVSVERLQMITPPQPGERPAVGEHGGYWMELQDGEGRVLAHRLLNSTLLNSTEVHTPGEMPKRYFGKPKSGVIEVLLPDVPGARTVVLLGNPLERARVKGRRAEPSGEIARFELSSSKERDRP